MKLLLLVLRASWKAVLLAGLIGAASGAASVGLVALIMHTLRDPDASTALAAALFGAELVLFRFGDRLFDSTFPILTLLGALGVMLVGSLRAAQAELARKIDQLTHFAPDTKPSQAGFLESGRGYSAFGWQVASGVRR